MKPIIFNTEMVKTILDGRKTQFRLPIKKEKVCEDWIMERQAFKDTVSKYRVGDILYVKETFAVKENRRTLYKDARIFLKVTNVRVERLDNYGLNVKKEGIREDGFYTFAVDSERERKRLFIEHWNSTAKDGYKWEDNPFVFVYEFERTVKEDN